MFGDYEDYIMSQILIIFILDTFILQYSYLPPHLTTVRLLTAPLGQLHPEVSLAVVAT